MTPATEPTSPANLERSYALEVLKKHKGQVTAAALELNLSRSTLTHWRDVALREACPGAAIPYALAAKFEFCREYPDLCPHEIIAAGHRNFEEWRVTLERHRVPDLEPE